MTDDKRLEEIQKARDKDEIGCTDWWPKDVYALLSEIDRLKESHKKAEENRIMKPKALKDNE